MDNITERVETFIKRLYDSSYEIDPKAQTIKYKRNIEMKSLADILAEQIQYYEIGKSKSYLRNINTLLHLMY